MKLRCLVVLLSLTTLLLTACQSKGPETPDTGTDLRSEIQALQQQLAEQKQLLEGIKGEVQGIKEMIQESRPSPPEDRERQVSIDDDYFKGKASAPLTLIEFSDFQCPFCAKFYKETLPLIDKEFIQTGKVKYVYRDFPIQSIHKNAFKAAEAANCAGEQGTFWEMHDILFENQKALEVDNLKEYADKLNLSMDRFSQCLESGKYVGEIQKDLEDGKLAGVGGTPAFYLGFTRPDKTIQGIPIKGAKPFTYFKQIIDEKLASRK